MLRVLIALALIALALPAAAERTALIVLNGSATEADAEAIRDRLRNRGFAVAALRGATSDAMRRTLAASRTEGLERLAVVLTGRFVHSARGAWFIGAGAPPVVTLATVEASGISLVTLAEIAAQTPGGAVLVLGEAIPASASTGPGLSPGVGPAAWLPPGVALVRGSDPAVTAFARDSLPLAGLPLASLVAARPGLSLTGPGGQAFVPPPAATAEETDWAAARSAGTEAAYATFLQRWPFGRRAPEARAAIAALRADPAAREAALGLTRDARLAVQRALTELGYDTRGIDGVFGPGTRSAIAAWQRATGRSPSGYLDGPQVAALQDDAARARAAREAADRAYWNGIAQSNDPAAFRSYLDMFPAGLFALIALERLAAAEAQTQAGRDQAAWDQAQAANTAAAYRAYLAAWPRGRFAAEAQARLAALDGTAADRSAWDRARRADTVAAYEAYLALWPRGAFAAEARERIAALQGGADQAMWNRARQADTIDAYQAYLADWPQGRFAAEARQRIAALQGEATDRSAWDRARRADTVESYRAYLDAFPRGLFAAEARDRIAGLAAEAEHRAWDRAQRQDTPAAYRGYIERFPNGPHVAEALARIAQLGGRPADEIGEGDDRTRLQVERALAAAGFDPGPVDGTFDRRTRAAIRGWQERFGEPVTGALTGPQVMRLLGSDQR